MNSLGMQCVQLEKDEAVATLYKVVQYVRVRFNI